MEMVFCFCEACLNELDELDAGGLLPSYLNAYSAAICANCNTEAVMVGTRKFEVALANVEAKDGVHQYTEFSVIRVIQET